MRSLLKFKLPTLIFFSLFVFSGCHKTIKKEATKIPNTEITDIIPKWAFGHIVWEDSINTQEAALNLVLQYKKHKIPVSGIIIDSPWSQSYNDFNWDTEKYPYPKKMISSFEEDHIKVIMWLTGCINISSRDVPLQKSPDYDYVIKKKYVVNNGKASDWWKGKGVHIDFTNPEAVKWWNSKLDKVFKKNIYGFKVDQGEYYFADSLSMLKAKLGQDDTHFGDTVTTSIGRISLREFKRYYYDNMYDYVKSRKKAGITLARPFSHQGDFAASINKLGLGWSGDFKGNYEGLKLQISNIYTSAKAGYGALACEIGGFYEDRSTKTQLIRYTQFGAFTACMINGGQNGAFTNHLAWYHDEETTEIYRYYVTLHNMLSPYMFSTVVDAHLKGGSLLKDVDFEQESHKLGNDIFFKAITSDTTKVSFILPPEGKWIDFWTGKKYDRGTQIIRDYSLKESPIFIRSGAIIPLEINNRITGLGDKSFSGKTVFLIYPERKSHYLYHKPKGEGIEFTDIDLTYEKGKLSIKSKIKSSFIFLIRMDKSPKSIKGTDVWRYNKLNHILEIKIESKDITLEIL